MFGHAIHLTTSEKVAGDASHVKVDHKKGACRSFSTIWYAADDAVCIGSRAILLIKNQYSDMRSSLYNPIECTIWTVPAHRVFHSAQLFIID